MQNVKIQILSKGRSRPIITKFAEDWLSGRKRWF